MGVPEQGKVEDGFVLAMDVITVNHCHGLQVCIMHGDIDQGDREQSLRDLKSGRSKVLIATDVASRGIDINDVT